MPTKLINLKIKHVAGVDRPANRRRFLVVKTEKEEPEKEEPEKKEPDKEEPEQEEPKEPPMLTKEQIAKIKDKDLQEAVMAQLEEMAELEKKVKDLEAKTAAPPKEDDEEIWKGVPPAIRNRFDAIQRDRDEMEKKAKGEKDEREVQEWTQKVSKLKYVQAVPQHFGKVMKKVAENAPEEADEVLRILQHADDLIDKGAIFNEIGRTRKNHTEVGDATNVVARVLALAGDYQQVDQKLSKAAAIEKVFKNKPDWYVPYKRETQIGGGNAD